MSAAPRPAHGRRARREPDEPVPSRRSPGAAWRLAVASFGLAPISAVRAPGDVDARTARDALLWAPLAALPLGLLVGVVIRVGAALGLPALGAGSLAVVVLALATRAVSLEGLTSTGDRLFGSGATGRIVGTVALLGVVGAQAWALGDLATRPRGAVVAGLLVCLSRGALLLTCVRGVPEGPDSGSAGPAGPYVGRVPRSAAVLGWLLVVTWTAVGTRLSGNLQDGSDYLRGSVTALVAAAAVGLLLWRGARRLGGVDRDLHGAGIEVTLTALLLGVATG